MTLCQSSSRMSKTKDKRDAETEVRLLEGIRRRCPDDERVWLALAEWYTA